MTHEIEKGHQPAGLQMQLDAVEAGYIDYPDRKSDVEQLSHYLQSGDFKMVEQA